MISATAKLLLHERTIVLECSIAPDATAIAATYQDFLDKYTGPISVDVEVIQDRDSDGVVVNQGHALIKFSLKDADDVEVLDSDDLPDIPEPRETSGSFSLAKGEGSDGLVEASPNLSPNPSLRTGLAEGEAKPHQISSSALMDEFRAMMAAKDTDKTLIKL